MMNIREVLQFVDEAVLFKTGKHLNDLQRGIIEGTLNRQRYADIAENHGCSAGHAKDIGYELLQLLSDVFDEPVDKKNLKSVLERQSDFIISLGERSISSIKNNIIGCVNMGSESTATTSDRNPSQTDEMRDERNSLTIEIAKKLQQLGLNNEQIAEALNLPLEVIEQISYRNQN